MIQFSGSIFIRLGGANVLCISTVCNCKHISAVEI